MKNRSRNRRERRAEEKERRTQQKAGAINPRTMFNTAENYMIAFNTLRTVGETNHQSGRYAVPANVMLALGTEIFLKCLVLLSTQKLIEDHDLVDLYDGLSDETKFRIEKDWEVYWNANQDHIDLWEAAYRKEPKLGKRDWTLDDALRASRNGFVKFRYIYEPQEETLTMSIHPLGLLARKLILEIHPEWNDPRIEAL